MKGEHDGGGIGLEQCYAHVSVVVLGEEESEQLEPRLAVQVGDLLEHGLVRLKPRVDRAALRVCGRQ